MFAKDLPPRRAGPPAAHRDSWCSTPFDFLARRSRPRKHPGEDASQERRETASITLSYYYLFRQNSQQSSGNDVHALAVSDSFRVLVAVRHQYTLQNDGP